MSVLHPPGHQDSTHQPTMQKTGGHPFSVTNHRSWQTLPGLLWTFGDLQRYDLSESVGLVCSPMMMVSSHGFSHGFFPIICQICPWRFPMARPRKPLPARPGMLFLRLPDSSSRYQWAFHQGWGPQTGRQVLWKTNSTYTDWTSLPSRPSRP